MRLFEILDVGLEPAGERIEGAMLPERILQDVLKLGFEALKNDQSILREMFYKLPSPVLKDITDYYDVHSVVVRQNFPRDAIQFPIVAVVNASDNEDQNADFLGSFMSADYDVSRTERWQILGHALRSEYQIFCLAGKDANAALWLYYTVKAILTVNHLTLDAHGLHNIVFTGRDITLREDLMPEFTFARVLSVTCGNYFAVRVSERVAKALEVRLFTEEPFSGTKTQVNVEKP